MDLSSLIDIFLHLDKHLEAVVQSYGPWVYALLFAIIFVETAAIVGDAVNYSVGRYFGPKVFGWENSRFFNRAAFDRTHAFYEKHGGITIIVARFLPFVRTFAPFVAGVAAMSYPRFAFYNVVGAVLWVSSLTTLGFLLGNTPWVKEHFEWVALAMIIIPGLPAVFEVLRHTVFKRRAA
jgi:membrane-associated protein